MTQTCTHDDVIRYVYHETNTEENEIIQEALLYDEALLDFYLDCIDLCTQLNQVQMIPSDRTIQKILLASRTQTPNYS